MIRLCVLAIIIASFALPRCATGQEDQYIRIYDLIQAGDNFRDSGKSVDALSRYSEAQASLQRFQKSYPEWNSNVVRFRLEYLAAELATISTNAPAPAVANGTNRVASTPLSAADDRAAALQSEVRQLQIDKAMLEAKLKEALTALPAAFDPREFAKAQEQISRLQKENELLKVSGQQAKTNSGVDPKAFDELKQKLAESDRKLAEQTELAKGLASEKTALQNKLNSVAPPSSSAPNVAANDRRVAEQTEAISKLNLEKTALQMRVKSLSAEAEKVPALREENQSLKKQLADFKIVPDSLTADAEKKLAAAEARIALLQSEKETLQKEKAELENRIKKALSTSGTQP
jgi:chromosome segregation ATPase